MFFGLPFQLFLEMQDHSEGQYKGSIGKKIRSYTYEWENGNMKILSNLLKKLKVLQPLLMVFSSLSTLHSLI